MEYKSANKNNMKVYVHSFEVPEQVMLLYHVQQGLQNQLAVCDMLLDQTATCRKQPCIHFRAMSAIKKSETGSIHIKCSAAMVTCEPVFSHIAEVMNH
jgi:hypothetical protein